MVQDIDTVTVEHK